MLSSTILLTKAISILVVIFVIFLLSKQMSKYFTIKSTTKKNHAGHKMLDRLIREQELKFRQHLPQNPLHTNNLTVATAPLDNLEKNYTEKIIALKNEHKENSEEYQSIQYILNLLSDLKWEERQTFRSFSQKLSNKWNICISSMEIVNCFKELLNSDLFYPKKDSDMILPKKMIDELITAATLINSFFAASNNQKSDLIKSFSKEYKITPQQTQQATIYFLLQELGEQPISALSQAIKNHHLEQNKLAKLSDTNRLEFLANRLIINNDGKIYSDSSILKDFATSTSFIKSFFPNDFKQIKDELKRSLLILGCTPNSSAQDIKKAYNQMAKVQHPDVFIQYKLEADLLKIINQNFTVIQNAYEIAKSFIKERSNTP